MDKELDELRDDIRRTLQAINDNLLELNDYLVRLRAQTTIELEEAMAALQRGQTVDQAIVRATEDPRRPYQNQRQPRRDGDSFANVFPQDIGGTYGTKTEKPGE